MGFEKILNTKTILKYLKLSIDGQELVKDDVISLNFDQNFDEFGISGTLKLKDTFDINNNGLILLNGDNLLTISLTDYLGNKSLRTYRIINTKIDPALERFEIYEFTFIDEVTFQLQNTFISKSFNSTPVEAFQEYLTELSIDTLLESDQLTTNIVDTSTKSIFVVPQNISVLDFFTAKFKEDNIRIWQDRSGLFIKEVVPSSLTIAQNIHGEDIVYTNKTSNNEYIYKIHDYQENKNQTGRINQEKPKGRTYRYSTDKMIVDSTQNLIDDFPNFKLSTLDITGIQLTTGEQYNTQSNFTVGNQTFENFDVFMKNNQLHIAVPGDVKNSNIGTVVALEMKGNIVSPESALKGDVMTGGKYFIGAVADTIIGDKLIQKLSLYRVDAREPR